MSTSEYNFYLINLEKVAISNDYPYGYKETGEAVSIEINFNKKANDITTGYIRYIKCEGLSDIGEARVYEETYANSNITRVFVPNNAINVQTPVKLTLIFVGDERRSVFDDFNKYIRNGYHAYWDTAREKKIYFYIKDAITPSFDGFKGGEPYIMCTYTLTNVLGITLDV